MFRLIWLNQDLGIAIVRVAFAIVVLSQAYPAWFVDGMPASIDLFTRLGGPNPAVTAYIVRAFELVGGTMVLFGLGVRWLGIWFIFQFLYSFSMIKMPHLGWDESRIDFMMLAGALMLFVAGAGAPSLDAWLEQRRAVSRSMPETA